MGVTAVALLASMARRLPLLAVAVLALQTVTARESKHCKPEQVHLALLESATQMRVMWKTAEERCDNVVHYYPANVDSLLQATQLQHAEQGVLDSYSSKDMCGSPAKDYHFDPPALHTVTLENLIPGKRYMYYFDDDADTTWTFTAAAEAGSPTAFTFLVYGDMGESEHAAAKAPGAAATAKAATAEVLDNGADLVFHVGDISYANGDPEIWDTFMDYIAPYASRAPYMIAVGNHEYDYHTGKEKARKDPSGAEKPYDPDWGNFGNDSGGECGVAVSRRFIMPGATPGNNLTHQAPAANSPFWYSFDFGTVHFTVVSTEHDLQPGSEQYEWVEEDLRSVDRCSTPWLIVGMHRPMYVPHPHKSNRIVGEHLRLNLESIFMHYEVDMVFSGHVHSYSRTCHVNNEECTEEGNSGIHHITIGSGGHKLSDIDHDQLNWLAAAERTYGYGRVHVQGADSLSFEFVATDDSTVRDSVDLRRDNSAPTCAFNVRRAAQLATASS